MTDVERLAQDYLAMWNEADPQARRTLVARTVTDDATYLDPMMSGDGVDGISAMIGAARPSSRVTDSRCTPDRTRITIVCASVGRSPRTVVRRWRSGPTT